MTEKFGHCTTNSSFLQHPLPPKCKPFIGHASPTLSVRKTFFPLRFSFPINGSNRGNKFQANRKFDSQLGHSNHSSFHYRLKSKITFRFLPKKKKAPFNFVFCLDNNHENPASPEENEEECFNTSTNGESFNDTNSEKVFESAFNSGVLRLTRIQNSFLVLSEKHLKALQNGDHSDASDSNSKEEVSIDHFNPNDEKMVSDSGTISNEDAEMEDELKDAFTATTIYLQRLGFTSQNSTKLSHNAPNFVKDLLQKALEEEETENLFNLTFDSSPNPNPSSPNATLVPNDSHTMESTEMADSAMPVSNANSYSPSISNEGTEDAVEATDRGKEVSEEESNRNLFEFDQNPSESSQSLVKSSQSFVRSNQNLVKSNQSLVESNQKLVKSSQSLVESNRTDLSRSFHTPMGFRILNLLQTMEHRLPLLYLESIGIRAVHVFRISKFVEKKTVVDVFETVELLRSVLEGMEQKKDGIAGKMVFMRKNLEVDQNLIDQDLDQVLTFMQRLEAQRGGVSQLNHPSTALPRLIESFPSILSRDLLLDLIPILSHLREDWGVSEPNLGEILLSFPPLLLFPSSQVLLERKRLLKQADIRVRDMGNMIVKYPWLLSKTIIDRVPKIAAFLHSNKVAIPHASNMISRYPLLLGRNVETSLLSSISSLHSMGVKSKRLADVLFISPNLLLRSSQDLDDVRLWLLNLGLSHERISHVLLKCPMAFSSSIPTCLNKKIEFLESLGLKPYQISRIVSLFPTLLTMSVLSMQGRLDYLREKGISKQDIAFMVYRFPPLLGYNVHTCLKPKCDYLLYEMGHSVHDIVSFPKYFSYSLDKRIKPRARVLKNRSVNCDLKTMLAISDKQFALEFLGMEQMFFPML